MENHLTLPVGYALSQETWRLHFSNCIIVCIQKRGLIKEKLEIAASHQQWKSISKVFFKLSWLEKMFENTPSWVMTGTYTKSNKINKINK